MNPGQRRLGKKEFLMVKKSAQRTRRTDTLAFTARVAVAALRGALDGNFDICRSIRVVGNEALLR